MPPNSSGSSPLLLNPSMRRAGPPVAGSSTPLAVQRSEFEDFMNAYRPNLDLPYREPPPQKPTEETKVDFGRSIKKLMKRPQGSPSVQNKNHRKEGIQRTPTVTSGYFESERGLGRDLNKAQSEKQKTRRPVSANIEANLSLPQPIFGQGPTVLLPLEANLLKSDSIPQVQVPPPASPTTKTPKTSIQQPPIPPQSKTPKPVAQQQSAINPVKTPKTSIQPPPAPPVAKTPRQKSTKNGLEDAMRKMPPESANVLSVTVPSSNPNQVKKVSIQEEKRRSGTEGYTDAHCLIITGNNIGRFLPPHHNPDPILNMRTVPVTDRKYHVILEFEESLQPPRPQTSSSGMMVFTPEVKRDSREQVNFFSWIKESHAAAMGLLLANVEKLTEFPFVTYLVVGGGRQELVQKLKFVGERPAHDRRKQLRFLAGYEEPVTICRPPMSTFPEKPTSDKTGFVVCLYQVLEYEDSLKFEQNWVMWTGARQLFRTLPEYMGLKRISVHKSVIPTKSINYVLICEFSNMMDYLMDACVLIDHLRARCCGFIGIYRVLDAL